MPPKPFPTHFLCIPLATASSRPQLAASITAFKDDVTSSDSFAVPAGAVRPVGTLHLTLGVMSFPKNEGLERAVDLLRTVLPRKILSEIRAAEPLTSDSDAQKDTPTASQPPLLSLTLKGLHSMHSASKATILYASPVDPDGTLQKFCEKLRQTFEEGGIMSDDKRPLLLHATVVNTIYVKGRRQGKKRERITIDAREIIDRYEDQIWAKDIPVEKIAICRMGAKESEDGHDQSYEIEAEIDMEASS